MYSLECDRVEEAGRLLTGLISRDSSKSGWRTKTFFDILYGMDDPWRVRIAAAKSLAFGLQLMYFENSSWTAGPRISMARQCMRTGRPDILRELVKRGPPPDYPTTPATPGATTEKGRWLDALSTRTAEASSYPEVIRWSAEDEDQWAAILADADPMHEGTACLAGTVAGAAFFELIMKRAVDARRTLLTQAPPPARRSLGV
jgi:hypothetical protein